VIARHLARGFKVKLRKLALAALVVGFAPAAHAAIWDWDFTDRGVNYSLSFDSLVGNTGTFTLELITTGYNQQPAAGAYLDSVDIKAWSGDVTSWSLLSAPNGTGAWTPSGGPIGSGPVGNTGCGGTNSSFTCAEATTANKGVFSVLNGTAINPYTFSFSVVASGFNQTSLGSHVGAGYANAAGAGAGYGITSVTAIPEPETYAMMLVGFSLLGFVARRRKQSLGNVVPA
jgi:hypothetical protein